MIYYTDEDIVIRSLIEEDAAILFSWRIDKEINEYDLRPTPNTADELINECKDFCKTFTDQITPTNPADRKYFYFIITDEFGKPIGCVNYFSINNEKKQCELGVTIGDRSYRRKGIALRAVEFAVNYIFQNTDIERICIETGEKNLPSLNLFSKLRFARCGEYLEENDYKFIVMERRRV